MAGNVVRPHAPLMAARGEGIDQRGVSEGSIFRHGCQLPLGRARRSHDAFDLLVRTHAFRRSGFEKVLGIDAAAEVVVQVPALGHCLEEHAQLRCIVGHLIEQGGSSRFAFGVGAGDGRRNQKSHTAQRPCAQACLWKALCKARQHSPDPAIGSPRPSRAFPARQNTPFRTERSASGRHPSRGEIVTLDAGPAAPFGVIKSGRHLTWCEQTQ